MASLNRLFFGVVAAAVTVGAHAFPQILNDWQSHYTGQSDSATNAGCQLCHASANGGSPWNAYGWDMRDARDQAACDANSDSVISNPEAFDCIQFFNSDNDTGQADNLTEILASLQPGWTNGECNTVYSIVSTNNIAAPAGIGDLDEAGTAPVTGCSSGPGDPPDPGKATIVTVANGESIQAAINSVAPGSTILIEPGVYRESGNTTNGLNISKGLRLIGLQDGDNGVTLAKAGDQRNGIVVVPQNRFDCLGCHSTLAPPFSLLPHVPTGGPTEPVINDFEIRNITIDGFVNNGLFTERVDGFQIVNVHSVNNRNYGIFPTLSHNGVIQHSSAIGADDSGIWVETSTHVRVANNLVDGNVNGFEVSNSDYITIENNVARNNSVGISLFVLTDLVDERPGANKIVVRNNHVHNNNKPNTGTPGSLLAELPRGTGILVLGVDNSAVEDNLIENNDFFGIVVADYCLGVQGTSFDCLDNPPPAAFDPVPERNAIIRNTLINNGTNAPSGNPFAPFAADITLFVPGDYGNCFSDNTLTTFIAITAIRPCSPLGPPFLVSSPSSGRVNPISPVVGVATGPTGPAIGSAVRKP